MRINYLTKPRKSRKHWIKEEIDILLKLGSTKTNKELTQLLERSIHSITWKCIMLGIKKTKETEFRARSLVKKGTNLGSYETRFGKQKADLIKQKISVKTTGENNPFYNKKHSSSTKAKISNARKKLFSNLDYVPYWKGRKNPSLLKRNLLNNPMSSKEAREKQSVSMKKFYIQHPDKHPNSLLRRDKMTKLELKFEEILINLGFIRDIDYFWNKCVQVDGGIRFPDFCFVNKKIIFEVDGIYWHKDKIKESIRDYQLRQVGYEIYHFSDEDIFKTRMEVHLQVESICG